jgi:hypothetical protein
LRGSGDRDNEQVVGRFLTCRSGESGNRFSTRRTCEGPFRFAVKVIPYSHRHCCSYLEGVGFSASGYRVAGHDRHSGSRVCLRFVKARRRGARLPQELRVQSLVAVGLPSNDSASSLRAGFTQSPRPSVHHKSSRCSQQYRVSSVLISLDIPALL